MNYFIGFVRIMEHSSSLSSLKKVYWTKLVAQLPNSKLESSFLELYFWGDLAHFVQRYYKINDLIFIEGYLSGFVSFNTSKKDKKLLFKIPILTITKLYMINLFN